MKNVEITTKLQGGEIGMDSRNEMCKGTEKGDK
jgi:hypothetical protein